MTARRIFKPKPGQIDYTRVRYAPVINCVVRYRGNILVVRRSRELRAYPGLWNGISGYLDDHKDLEEKVREELREEAGIRSADIRKISIGELFHQDAPELKKTWIVHPVLVELTTDRVRLNWEAEEYRFVAPLRAARLPTVPGFKKVIARALKAR